MHRSLRPLLASLASACTALLPPARASTLLDVEAPSPSGAYFSGDNFDHSDFRLTQFNGTCLQPATVASSAVPTSGTQCTNVEAPAGSQVARFALFDADISRTTPPTTEALRTTVALVNNH